jgi:hypothetical protein
MKMNLQHAPEFIKEINDLFNKADSSTLNDFFNSKAHEGYTSPSTDTFIADLEVRGITLGHVDSFGGEEQGADYYSVYEFKKGTEVALVKFDGWYASYSGSEYSKFLFVKPEPTTVIVYNPVNFY